MPRFLDVEASHGWPDVLKVDRGSPRRRECGPAGQPLAARIEPQGMDRRLPALGFPSRLQARGVKHGDARDDSPRASSHATACREQHHRSSATAVRARLHRSRCHVALHAAVGVTFEYTLVQARMPYMRCSFRASSRWAPTARRRSARKIRSATVAKEEPRNLFSCWRPCRFGDLASFPTRSQSARCSKRAAYGRY